MEAHPPQTPRRTALGILEAGLGRPTFDSVARRTPRSPEWRPNTSNKALEKPLKSSSSKAHWRDSHRSSPLEPWLLPSLAHRLRTAPSRGYSDVPPQTTLHMHRVAPAGQWRRKRVANPQRAARVHYVINLSRIYTFAYCLSFIHSFIS